RTALLSWYYLRGLARAGADAGVWARRAAGLGEAVVPDLLELLGGDEERACGNARAALACLGEGWGREDPRCAELLDEGVRQFPRLSGPGKPEALRLATDGPGPEPPCPAALVASAGRLLPEAARQADAALQDQALRLALRVVRQTKEPTLLCPVRELARACLRAPAAPTRLRAVRLSMQPGL